MNLFQWISIVGIGLSVLACVVHFAAFRPRRAAPPAGEPRDVRRYGLWERLVHLGLLLSFLVLLVTSFGPVLAGQRMGGYLLMLHTAAGAAFAVGLAAMMITWAVDSRLEKHDGAWIRKGGCLGPKQALPAGRFDAAEKIYFWAAGVLGLVALLTMMLSMVPLFGTDGQWALFYIHRASALLLVMATIVHAYRTTVAKPGTWRALLSGRVSARWARVYHSLWWESRSARRPARPD